MFGLPEAPVFYPTNEQFSNPWEYLNSIKDHIEKTGICVIQPPQGDWDFGSFKKLIDYQKFNFVTKAQNIHQMHRRSGTNVDFVTALRRFWLGKGRSLFSLPYVYDDALDVYQLKVHVEKLGGLEKVDEGNKWLEIACSLRLTYPEEGPVSEEICKALRDHYVDFLAPYLESLQAAHQDAHPHETLFALDDEANSDEKKRKGNWNDKRPGKKVKPLTSVEPIWSQVKSRSFAKDAKDFVCASDSSSESSVEEVDPETITEDFGYSMGAQFTLQQFQEMAVRFEKRWSHCTTPADKEKEYWRVIESGEELLQVQYGSDLDVAVHGSGFPFNPDAKVRHVTKDKARKILKSHPNTSPYMINSGWNTNNLAESTFLHHINESVAGVTRPMMYVGMMFSSFCWHVEDNYLYSINYIHEGKPKLWYGVPSIAAELFEKTMRQHLPDLFDRNPNLLHLLVTQLSPDILTKAGVPIYTTLQNSGQFVVTCPRSYHAGFNTGFNCAESVNFALENWLPFCKLACENYRFNRAAVFPFEEFVVKGARNPDSQQVAKTLHHYLSDIIEKEQTLQNHIYEQGITKVVTSKRTPVSTEESLVRADKCCRPCSVCGYDCYLSGIKCTVHGGVFSCLSHMERLCDCPSVNKRLVVNLGLEDLNSIAADTLNYSNDENMLKQLRKGKRTRRNSSGLNSDKSDNISQSSLNSKQSKKSSRSSSADRVLSTSSPARMNLLESSSATGSMEDESPISNGPRLAFNQSGLRLENSMNKLVFHHFDPPQQYKGQSPILPPSPIPIPNSIPPILLASLTKPIPLSTPKTISYIPRSPPVNIIPVNKTAYVPPPAPIQSTFAIPSFPVPSSNPPITISSHQPIFRSPQPSQPSNSNSSSGTYRSPLSRSLDSNPLFRPPGPGYVSAPTTGNTNFLSPKLQES